MPNETIEFDSKGLDNLIKALSTSEDINIRIGILGGGSRKERKKSNAEIGLDHEFGKDGHKERSFLRMPLTTQMQRYLDNSQAFDVDALKQVIKLKSIKIWAQKVAIIAETIIQDAFDTGGFGQWIPSKMQFKKNHQTLVETQQLRESITSEVK